MAVDEADVITPNVPVAIEAETQFPPVLQARPDDPDLKEGRLSLLNPGTFTLRIRTICGIPDAEVLVTGRVSEQAPN